QKTLIKVARLVELKGHARLLEVIKQLPQNYSLTIAGDGPLRNEIEEQINKLDLQKRVKMLGEVSNVERLIAQHDLLVLSSFTEGFPNVVIEALSVGTPVVTFRVGGVSSVVIDGFNGYIVEQGDLEEFKNKILHSCNKEWDVQAIRSDVFNRFSIEKITEKYQQLIS